ncbi:hypothetical protein GCM10023195_81420 [Actinoallomurus liliacearum]|uniref:HTH cro/C1-type domain-containing protein n=1 Tax=Actinoallomurus liliacearum TaxID=1080073 RepID=A0ABP8U1F4_9ACTN
MSGSAFEPIKLPGSVWRHEQTRALLRARDIGGLFHLAKKYAGASQNRIAVATGVPQPRVNALMRGTGGPILQLEVFERIADGLNMPDDARICLGLAPASTKTSEVSQPRPHRSADSPEQRIDDLIAEITASDTQGDVIEQLASATHSLAESHTRIPASRIIAEVLRLHGQARELSARRQRLSQQRELYRVESQLLAHACLLLGDLGQNFTADKYGAASVLYAQEAGANEAVSWSARAKTLRWQDRYIESADMARRGYDCSPAAPIRVQLASQEANAAALMGDIARAREALRRSEVDAETVAADSGLSAWSFPVTRQALFNQSVAINADDPEAALRAAQMADEAWASGTPQVLATWAQIRTGAAIAHLMKGSLDGTIEELKAVLTLAPEFRVSTVTAFLENLERRLGHPDFRSSRDAIELRQKIRTFNSAAPVLSNES